MAKQGTGTKVLPNALWRNSVREACLSPPRTRKTFCPLEQSGRIIGSSTLRFAKQVGIKMACNAARDVQQDFLECQGRKISASFLQNLSHKVAGIAEQQETQWHYDLPNFQKATASIAISLDGTCMHLSKEGWREAMAGTISFYDAKGERQHTIYMGATPEYGKAEFLRRFTAEIERVKALFPNAKTVGLADGAECNWQFLTPHTQMQVLDFYHASSYLGAVANAKYPKDKSAHKEWLEDRCHQLKHTAGAAEALYNEMVVLQRAICAATLSRFTGEKGAAISSQNIFLGDSQTRHLTILGAEYRENSSEPVFRQ